MSRWKELGLLTVYVARILGWSVAIVVAIAWLAS
jgi:hypothetical protein